MMNGKIRIKRYRPETDSVPHYQEYQFSFKPGQCVLDVMFYLYENVDGTLGFRYCCRNNRCGMCGAKINGKAGLMCNVAASEDLTLEPLDNLPVLRDLIVDRSAYSRRKDNLRPFLDRVIPHQGERAEQIDLSNFDKLKRASRCIECYCCVSSCPVLSRNPHVFDGPSALVQLARHAFDPRDDSNRGVIAHSSGISNCIGCKKCSEVCPHHIDPMENVRCMQEMLTGSK